MSHRTAVVILAAGHGTRMKSDLPKVMHELHGKPLVGHIVDAVVASGVTEKPVVVVAPDSDLVRSYLGERATFVVQENQLGTGDATRAAEQVLLGDAEHIMVVYADLPFLSSDSIKRLAEQHAKEENTVTMLTSTVENFEGQNEPFYSFGRIVRDEVGGVRSITEMRDCTDEQKQIRELNTGSYCYEAHWLWSHLGKLNTDNDQEEYYLTDLVEMAIEEGEPVATVDLDPNEAYGISSQEDLEKAHRV